MRILDTDTCIELLRGNERVLDKRSAVMDEVVTTWISASELYFGAARSSQPEGNRALVDEFLAATAPIDINLRAAQTFGEIKASLLRSGESLPDADLLIGAIAIARGAILVTGNARHFEKMPGLLLEDWIRD